eukprot:TRINITY_DN3618_c0_g1_i1.p1 TRINITY_DN3618_c0_g1~~TRINITY_DN3618_c0_g1_i1.p1  ORF type:complete len:360 (+),score=39.05 TRINITY_DN3618_c0_g1_i1:28-1107(+)
MITETKAPPTIRSLLLCQGNNLLAELRVNRTGPRGALGNKDNVAAIKAMAQADNEVDWSALPAEILVQIFDAVDTLASLRACSDYELIPLAVEACPNLQAISVLVDHVSITKLTNLERLEIAEARRLPDLLPALDRLTSLRCSSTRSISAFNAGRGLRSLDVTLPGVWNASLSVVTTFPESLESLVLRKAGSGPQTAGNDDELYWMWSDLTRLTSLQILGIPYGGRGLSYSCNLLRLRIDQPIPDFCTDELTSLSRLTGLGLSWDHHVNLRLPVSLVDAGRFRLRAARNLAELRNLRCLSCIASNPKYAAKLQGLALLQDLTIEWRTTCADWDFVSCLTVRDARSPTPRKTMKKKPRIY